MTLQFQEKKQEINRQKWRIQELEKKK